MKYLLFLLFSFCVGQVQAQKPVAKPAGVKPTSAKPVTKKAAADLEAADTTGHIFQSKDMELQDIKVEGLLLVFHYNLPYNGMVELKMYDAKNKQVFADQYINNVGPNQIRIKAAGFKPGSYTCLITFKGKEQKATVTL